MQVGKGQLLRFDLRVQFLDAARRVGAERKLRKNVQHLERADALAVGRQFVDLPPAIFGGDGLHPFAGEFAQVGGRHFAAQAIAGFQDRFGDGALVEGRGPLVGDQFHGRAEFGVAEDLAQLGRHAVGQVDAPGIGIAGKFGRLSEPGLVDDLGDRVAVFRVVDCGREDVFPGQLAELLMEFGPAIDAARHGHRLNAELRHGGIAHGFEQVDGEALGRPAAGVDAGQLAGFGLVVDDEEIAADAAALRFHDAESGIGRDGRIDGGTAAGQDLRAGLRCQGLGGGYDSAIADGHGTRLRAVLGGCERCQQQEEKHHDIELFHRIVYI